VVSGRHFAIKMLLPERAKNAESRRLLFHEAAVGVKLAHPNIIKIVKIFKEIKQPCFVMEFFPSGSMRQRISYREWVFIREHAESVFKQTATGLAYMNSNGWLHRDVKPDNILVNSAGEVRLIDFAIAEPIPSALGRLFRRRSKPAGTRSYMSPEAVRGEVLDSRSDIYSFGATCYEIVTLMQPFRAPTANDLLNKQLFERPKPPQVYCPDLTDEFAKFILRMLSKKPGDRPQSFHEVLMQLRKMKVFKRKDAAPPKGGGQLFLHPETAATRKGTVKGPLPKAPPAAGPKPPADGTGNKEQQTGNGEQGAAG
jgi:serine/threonine-protein kinase